MPETITFAPLPLSQPQPAAPPPKPPPIPKWRQVSADPRFAERDTEGKLEVLDNWTAKVLENRDAVPGFNPAIFYDLVQKQRAALQEQKGTMESAGELLGQFPGMLRDTVIGFGMLASEALRGEKAMMQGKAGKDIDRPIMRNVAGQTAKFIEGYVTNNSGEEQKLNAFKQQFRDAVGREEFPKDPQEARDWFTAWENTLKAQAKLAYPGLEGLALNPVNQQRQSLTDNEDNLKGIAAFISTKNPKFLDPVLNRVTAGPAAQEADKMKEADTKGMAEWQKRAFDFAADPANLLATAASIGVGAAVAAPLKAGAGKAAQVALRTGAVVADAEINAQASKLSAWLQNPSASDAEMDEAAKQGRFAAYLFAGLGYGGRKVVDKVTGKKADTPGDTAPPQQPASPSGTGDAPRQQVDIPTDNPADILPPTDTPGTTTVPLDMPLADDPKATTERQPKRTTEDIPEWAQRFKPLLESISAPYQMAANLEALPQRAEPLGEATPAPETPPPAQPEPPVLPPPDTPGTTTGMLQPPQPPTPADLAYQMAANLEALPQRAEPLGQAAPARPAAGVMPRTLEPVPESPAMLAAQAERLAEGRKPAMLIAKGEVPPSIPKGFDMVEVAEGTVIYDPQTFDAEGIREAAANNQLNDVLSYGVPAKAADAERAVVQRDANGTEIAAVGTNAAEVPQVTAALEDQAKPGDTIAVEDPALSDNPLFSRPNERRAMFAPEGTENAARKVAGAAGASIGPGASSTGEWRTHKASLRLANDTRLTPRTRELLQEGQDYRVVGRMENLEDARRVIESAGGLRAAIDALDATDVEPRVKVALSELAIRKLDSERALAKTADEINALDDIIDEVARKLNSINLEAGRAVEANKHIGLLTPESILSELAERVQERMQQGRNTPLGEKMKETQATVGPELEAVTKEKDKTARDIDTATHAELDRLNSELEAAKVRLREMEIAAAAEANATGKPVSKASKTKADAENRRIRQLERDIADLEALGKMEDLSLVNELDRRTAERRARKALAEGKQSQTLKDLRAARDAMRKELDNRATDQRRRTRLEADIAEMDRLIREGTPEEIAAKLEPANKPRRVQPDDLIQARLRLRNLQSEATRLQSLMLGMPKELQTKVRDLAYRIRQAPDGIWKADLNRELLAEIGRWEGVDILALGEEYWLANLLSGLNTQGVNIFGNGLNLFLRSLITGAREGKLPEVANMLAGMARGMREGGRDFIRAWQGKDIIKWQEKMGIHETGIGKNKNRTRNSALEMAATIFAGKTGAKARAMQAVALGRYVFRALGGMDAFFWRTAYEGRVALAVTRWARSEVAAKGGNLAHYVADALHNSTDQAAAALKQAEKEAKELGIKATKRDIDARAWEIMDAQRPEQARAEARRYADLTTYTAKPEGSMGIVAGILNRVVDSLVIETPYGDLRPVKAVVPFVNTLANVASQAMDFTPIGIARGLHGRHLIGRERMPFTNIEARERLFAGIVGTTVAGLVYGLAGQGGDPDNPFFEVTGEGPSDPTKRNQLRNQGWTPFSIKVGGNYYSYKESPMCMMLAMIGGVRDLEKYSTKYSKEENWARVAYVAATVPQVMSQQGMMSGIETLSGVMSGQPNKLRRFAEGVGKGFVPAVGLMRDIGRVFDPTVVNSKTLAGALLKDVPVIRRELNEPALNAFGEPVRTVGLGRVPVISRIASTRVQDKEIEFIANNGLWIPGFDNTVNVGQGLQTKGEKLAVEQLIESRVQQLGRTKAGVLTDAELRKYIKMQGQYLRKGVAFMASRHANGIGAKDKEGMQKELDNVTSIARKMAMRDLLGFPQRR